MLREIHADTRRLLRRRQARGIAEAIRIILYNHGLHALVVYRYGHWLRTLGERRSGAIAGMALQPFYRLAAWLVRKMYGIDLDPGADIAPGLLIGHFSGIVVSKCRIGPNCAIQQQVTLAPARPGDAGPVLGSRVWVGAHARIQGPVRIGTGATIGAGALVTGDVPAGCLVLGNPGRIVQRDFDNHVFL